MMSAKTANTLELAQPLLQLQCGWVIAPATCFMHKLAEWIKGHKLVCGRPSFSFSWTQAQQWSD